MNLKITARRVFGIVLALLLATCFRASAAPVPPSFNVFTYGATGNGATLDTVAIQRAIDAAGKAGGNAEVIIPQGFSFLVGTLVLRGGIDFHVDGELIGSTNATDYAEESLITASNAMNFTISGAGSIAGSSLAFMTNYDRVGECWRAGPWRPGLVLLAACTNLTVRDISLGDAPAAGLRLLGCHNALIDHVTVRNRLDLTEDDGIVADHCQQMEIRNCDVLAGGDAIVVKASQQNADYGPSANIFVHDCQVQTQSTGLGLGNETAGDIRDIGFERCRVTSAGRAISIQMRDQGSVSNIIFGDIQFLARYYSEAWRGGGEGISLTAIPRTAETKLGVMADIVLTNITGRAENSLRLDGSPASHISGVRLEKIYVTLDRWTKYRGGHYDNRPCAASKPIEPHVTAGLNIRYADGVILKNCVLRWGKNLPEYFTYALETDHATGVELWDFKGTSAHPGVYEDMLLR